MTSAQFNQALGRLELSTLQAASLLQCTERSVRRYITGDFPVPGAVSKLLNLALQGKITIKDIEHA